MFKYTKISALLSVFFVLFVSTAAYADVPIPGSSFRSAHPVESGIYPWIALLAAVAFVVGFSLYFVNELRKQKQAKKEKQAAVVKNIEQK